MFARPNQSPPTFRDFIALTRAYEATGGIMSGDDLGRSLDEQRHGALIHLARQIVAGVVFSFKWHDAFWVPMFQFDPADLSLKDGPRQVVAELVHEIDDWSLATWFAWPNSRLDGRKPIDVLDGELPAVLEAARARRAAPRGLQLSAARRRAGV